MIGGSLSDFYFHNSASTLGLLLSLFFFSAALVHVVHFCLSFGIPTNENRGLVVCLFCFVPDSVFLLNVNSSGNIRSFGLTPGL